MTSRCNSASRRLYVHRLDFNSIINIIASGRPVTWPISSFVTPAPCHLLFILCVCPSVNRIIKSRRAADAATMFNLSLRGLNESKVRGHSIFCPKFHLDILQNRLFLHVLAFIQHLRKANYQVNTRRSQIDAHWHADPFVQFKHLVRRN